MSIQLKECWQNLKRIYYTNIMIYHNYILLASDTSLHKVSKELLKSYQKEFLQEMAFDDKVVVHTYATLGLKVQSNILLWLQSDEVERIQVALNRLMHTKLGEHLQITYTLFGMIRPSQYSRQSVDHDDTGRKGGKYMIIYPFNKTQSWYMLDLEKRKELMKGHIQVGRKYPQISQLLLYSYGVDDNEFIVSYDTDDLLDFQKLVMELRSDPVREYTLKDTPIFTCIYKKPEEALEFL